MHACRGRCTSPPRGWMELFRVAPFGMAAQNGRFDPLWNTRNGCPQANGVFHRALPGPICRSAPLRFEVMCSGQRRRMDGRAGWTPRGASRPPQHGGDSRMGAPRIPTDAGMLLLRKSWIQPPENARRLQRSGVKPMSRIKCEAGLAHRASYNACPAQGSGADRCT